SVHAQMIDWARMRIDHLHWPFDGWYPYFAFGSARFHHYPSLAHITGGLLSYLFGTTSTYFVTLYVLLASWPISVYIGARLLGWDPWAAGGAALVSPLLASAPGRGYEYGSYIWRGSGLWAQLWGMWLLPLAWGASYRAIAHRRGFTLAAVLIAATIGCHFLTGYMALLVIPLWVIATPSDLLGRIRRGAVVAAGGLVAAAWVLVPLIADRGWSNVSPSISGTVIADSFGAHQVLSWLVHGALYDDGHFPIVSILLAIGLVVCVVRFRSDERARALLLAWLAFMVLFFGRPTLGRALKLLPGSQELLFRRFVGGVHLAGILIAGVGLAYVVRLLWAGLHRVVPRINLAATLATAVVIVLGILSPAWLERSAFAEQGARWMAQQRAADETTGTSLAYLIREAESLGGGRIYSGARSNWGADFRVDFVPVYSILANLDADALGFTYRTTSISTDIEAYFDEQNTGEFDLFNVRYLVYPATRPAPLHAVQLDQRGDYRLWEVPTSGYLQIVDTSGQVAATRANLAGATLPFLRSTAFRQNVYPTVAFNGHPAGLASIPPGRTVTRRAGSIISETDDLPNGKVTGTIDATRPAVVLLKASFDPRWVATVDGKAVTTEMVAPSFIGVPVSAGRHSIELEYHPYPFYWLLFGLAIVALGGLVVFGRRVTRSETATPEQQDLDRA
ncbi:MAG: hypothetical protein QOF16_1174, partial [Actinomycetota bacterium]|nr:hypothetical protein [Actinomycetota bacterium]